jgi:CDP-paratose 2-epimerase
MSPAPSPQSRATENGKPIVVTGGAGFIGCNLARSFLLEGRPVRIIDNLSRPGVEQNLRWLREQFGSLVAFVRADVTDCDAITPTISDAGAVFHFAAQTAVTTSLDHPVDDFNVNAGGTLNVLEAARRAGPAIPVIFSSTNKVYGGLADLGMHAAGGRYVPDHPAVAQRGIGEDRPLDFCTPYGCSKGVADQYVLDYGKSYGLSTAVLRMSCIYGPRQFGTEDQGWVAHFLIRALNGQSISIYGDGMQVRDILFVEDAVRAYRALLANIDRVGGRAFNLGGGPANAVSVREVLEQVEALTARPLAKTTGDWRRGDQLYFVADTFALEAAVGWRATVGWRDGITRLHDWLISARRSAPARERALA